jgi:hypothetical protein
MKQLRIKITGLSPLMHHSERGANPLDEATKAHKALTAKRKKTDADHEAIAKSEWLLSLYWSEKSGPYIPGQNLDASIKNGAKLQKLGTRFAQVVTVEEDEVPIVYKGPRDPEGMFKAGFFDVRGVRVGTAKVMRCRPRFKTPWEATFTLTFDEDVVNDEEVRKAVTDAGRLIGLCDNRPRYGKFRAEVL